MQLFTASVKGALGPEKTSTKENLKCNRPLLITSSTIAFPRISRSSRGYSEVPAVPNFTTLPSLTLRAKAECRDLVREQLLRLYNPAERWGKRFNIGDKDLELALQAGLEHVAVVLDNENPLPQLPALSNCTAPSHAFPKGGFKVED